MYIKSNPIKYTFFDEHKNKIAVIYKGTNDKKITKLKEKYDEILFE